MRAGERRTAARMEFVMGQVRVTRSFPPFAVGLSQILLCVSSLFSSPPHS